MIKFILIVVATISVNASALEVDFDREQVTCGKVTYQFDFKYKGDRAVYDKVENYWVKTQDRSLDPQVCHILFKYFCDMSAPFKLDNPKCF